MSTMDIEKLFNNYLRQEKIESFLKNANEASLQFDFAWHLKTKYNYAKFYLEYSIKKFDENLKKDDVYKSEMDLFIDTGKKKIGVEFKFPQNGAYPKRMFQALEDITFLEGLKNRKHIDQGYSIFITPNKLFFYGKEEGFYQHFRKNRKLIQPTSDEVKKYENTGVKQYKIDHHYTFDLTAIKYQNDIYYYYIIKI